MMYRWIKKRLIVKIESDSLSFKQVSFFKNI